MSLIAELLKANSAKPSQLVLNQQNLIKLGVGDLLKLPQGEHVQAIRQGQDLLIVMDAGDGSPAENMTLNRD